MVQRGSPGFTLMVEKSVRAPSRALQLAYFTVAWNLVEGVGAIWAAIAAQSDALGVRS